MIEVVRNVKVPCGVYRHVCRNREARRCGRAAVPTKTKGTVSSKGADHSVRRHFANPLVVGVGYVNISVVVHIIPEHGGDLLNATVRHVLADDDTFLRYADRELLSIVMLFSQERTPEGEAAMEAMTRDLIDAALASEGRYYLPYRLHATPEQFHAAYPQARVFFELKRKHDPDEIFQNRFYTAYGHSN